MLKGCSFKTYITNSYKPQIAYVENNLYKKQDSIIFNNTNEYISILTNIQPMLLISIR